MPFKAFDRVKETTTTTGTGSVSLAGATPGGYRTFASVFSNNDTLQYAIIDAVNNAWEVGRGTFLTGPTLQRNTVIASSNAGALVSFASGSKDVFNTYSALDGVVEIGAQTRLTGIISPAQITSDQADYAPTDIGFATTLRLNSDANRLITGITTGATGRVLVLQNVGTFAIGLANDAVASSATNRFLCPHGHRYVIDPNEVALLMYDGTSSRWRVTEPAKTKRVQTLTDAATIAWPLDSGSVARVTLTSGVGANRNFGAPTNIREGDSGWLDVIQGASGGPFTITWNSVFKHPLGTPPTLSTAANARDRFYWSSFDGVEIDITFAKGMA